VRRLCPTFLGNPFATDCSPQQGQVRWSTPGARVEWLEAAKACGMVLVFYGHFVEWVYDLGNQEALAQQKLIYAFHMPLFVVLAGFLARSAPELPGFDAFLKRQAASRLLPVVFFSLLLMPFSALFDSGGWEPEHLKAEYVDDWPDLGRRLSPPAEGEQPAAQRRLWEGLPAPAQALFTRVAAGDSLDPAGREAGMGALNEVLGPPNSLRGPIWPGSIFLARSRSGSPPSQRWAARSRCSLNWGWVT